MLDKVVQVGSNVKVCVDSLDRDFAMITKFNGQVKRINKVVHHKSYTYYELDDCVSEHGIPYGFMPEHLEQVGGLL